MAIFYRYTDANAPTKPSSADYNGPLWFMNIVKACLVTGYGNKAGAGWTIVYDDNTVNAKRIAFSNGNGVIEFVTWGTTGVAVFIWDSITTPKTGRIFNKTWSQVVSVGVNGWAAANSKLPKASAVNVICLDFAYAMDTNECQWTIAADNKSCWINFHYPLDSASAVKGTDVYPTSTYHPKLFFGAIKGPDFDKNELGNFFCGYGEDASAAAAPSSTVYQSSIQKLIGLRTPVKTVPAANIDYSIGVMELTESDANPRNSLRLLTPVFVYYSGTGRPKPSGISDAESKYIFAQLPGISQFSRKGSGFWKFYTAEHSAVSNQEILTIAGDQWMPISIFNGYPAAEGITSSSEWWT